MRTCCPDDLTLERCDDDCRFGPRAEAKEPKGTINLDGCSVDYVPETKYKRKFCFELTSPAQSRVYVLEADNGTSVQDWMNAVRSSVPRLACTMHHSMHSFLLPSSVSH